MGKAVKQNRAGAATAPRRSLAATHPSNYVKAASTKMPPPSAPTHADRRSATAPVTEKFTPTTATPLHLPYPTPSPSPPEKLLHDFATPSPRNHASRDSRACPQPGGRPLDKQGQLTQTSGVVQHGMTRPWEQHNDPTLTVSDSPPYWSRNHTVLKADTNTESGNVISPTFMHGLPFGSMTEAAHHYPSEENLSCLN